MSDWHEDVLHYKYDPLPDEPRHKKKGKKKQRIRSDHKHVYETVCVNAHDFVRIGGIHGERLPFFHIVKRCEVCGRIGDVSFRRDVRKPPEGMPYYEVPDWSFLMTGDVLPEGMRVR